jgi:hypothetical protein
MKKKKLGAELEQEPADTVSDPITGENWHAHKTKKKKKKKDVKVITKDPDPKAMAAAVMIEWVINRFFQTVPDSLMAQTEFEMEHFGEVTASTVARWERHMQGWPQ